MNREAINMVELASLWQDETFLRAMPKNASLRDMDSQLLEKPPYLFSQWLYKFAVLLSMDKCFL